MNTRISNGSNSLATRVATLGAAGVLAAVSLVNQGCATNAKRDYSAEKPVYVAQETVTQSPLPAFGPYARITGNVLGDEYSSLSGRISMAAGIDDDKIDDAPAPAVPPVATVPATAPLTTAPVVTVTVHDGASLRNDRAYFWQAWSDPKEYHTRLDQNFQGVIGDGVNKNNYAASALFLLDFTATPVFTGVGNLGQVVNDNLPLEFNSDKVGTSIASGLLLPVHVIGGALRVVSFIGEEACTAAVNAGGRVPFNLIDGQYKDATGGRIAYDVGGCLVVYGGIGAAFCSGGGSSGGGSDNGAGNSGGDHSGPPPAGLYNNGKRISLSVQP